MAAVRKPRKKAAYKMPDPLPQGEILQDISKKKWRLGKSIGKGGFGEIYSAQEYLETKNSSAYPYVIKIEPHENGPLFVEMHFYMRNAKPEDVEAFRSSKKLKRLGMPKYIGSGSHEHKGQKYRFLVIEKFGTDIWKLFLENNRTFPAATVFKLGVQILDVLEYIHSKSYVHADIKGANILLGTNSAVQEQVYLVDFGLASRYTSILKPDPKKAHNGTIEYTSRDAHLGVPTRRGDLEILSYNLVQWLGCTLPWEHITDPAVVYQSKVENMNNINKFLKTCFGSKKVPATLMDFLSYINSLDVETDPDYSKLRKCLVSGIKAVGDLLTSPLQFGPKKLTPSKRKAETKMEKEETQESDENINGTKPKVIKRRPKKVIQTDSDDVSVKDDSSNEILTYEMKRLKEKIKQKQKIGSTKTKKGQ